MKDRRVAHFMFEFLSDQSLVATSRKMLAYRNLGLDIYFYLALRTCFLFASGEWHLQATGVLKFYFLFYATIILCEVSSLFLSAGTAGQRCLGTEEPLLRLH